MTDTDAVPHPAEDERQYIVRLLLTVNASSSEEAVVQFVDRLVENGLRNWVYGVIDPDTGQTVATFNGWGENMDARIAELQRQDAQGSSPAPEPAEPVEVHIDDPDSDPELLALAQRLNEGS